MSMPKLFDFELVFRNIPKILEYLPITLELAGLSMVFGILLGLLLAIIKIKKIPVLHQISSIFISVIRGTPIIVQLYVTYFGIPIFLKYINYYYGTNYNVNHIPGIVFALIALSINESAYNSEIIRAALQSVDRGQIEAANALGMTSFQAFRRIIFPEALEVALPSLGNSIIGLIKGTSLAFVCSVVEMTAKGKIIAGNDYRYFEVYVSLALIYWVITIVIEQIIRFWERKIKVPDVVPEKAYE